MTGEQKLKAATHISRDIALSIVNKAKWFEFKGRQNFIAQAQSKPLPGAAGKAFTSGAIKVGGRVINRVVPAHFAILQALDSPLLKMIESATTKNKVDVDFKANEQWEVCYVFTNDAETTYEILETEGVKAIKSEAKKGVGMKWEAAEVNLAMLAVIEQIKRHIQTTVKMAAEMEASGDVSFFQEQSQPL
jgi:hypothetical protein